MYAAGMATGSPVPGQEAFHGINADFDWRPLAPLSKRGENSGGKSAGLGHISPRQFFSDTFPARETPALPAMKAIEAVAL